MQVTKEMNSSFLVTLLHKLLSVIYCWMNNFRRRFPTAVQITARKRATVISIYDSIRIQHGNDFENKIFPEEPCLNIVRISDELNNTAHHP
jgi:hypothetical protein